MQTKKGRKGKANARASKSIASTSSADGSNSPKKGKEVSSKPTSHSQAKKQLEFPEEVIIPPSPAQEEDKEQEDLSGSGTETEGGSYHLPTEGSESAKSAKPADVV